MDLRTYLSEGRGRLSRLAKEIGAHAPDVSRWASGERPIPVHFGAPIERATSNMVTRQEMFPETWRVIWPELATQHDQRFETASSLSREDVTGTADSLGVSEIAREAV